MAGKVMEGRVLSVGGPEWGLKWVFWGWKWVNSGSGNSVVEVDLGPK